MEKFQDFPSLKRRVAEKASDFFFRIIPPRHLQRVYERFARTLGLEIQVESGEEGGYSYFLTAKIFSRHESKRLFTTKWVIFPSYCERFLIFDPKEEPHRTRAFVEGFRELYPRLDEETDRCYFLLGQGDPLFSLFLDQMKENYASLEGCAISHFYFMLDAIESYIRHVRDEEKQSYFLHLLVWFYLFLYLSRASGMKTVLFARQNTLNRCSEIKNGLVEILAYLELREGDFLASELPDGFPKNIVLAGAPIGIRLSLSSEEDLRPHELDHAIPLSEGKYINTLRNDFCAVVPVLTMTVVWE